MRAALLSLLVLVVADTALADGAPPLHGSDRPIEMPGLHAPAVVLRDDDGVPHIYAFDEHDALFLQGLLHAQDRLFQIEFEPWTALDSSQVYRPARAP